MFRYLTIILVCLGLPLSGMVYDYVYVPNELIPKFEETHQGWEAQKDADPLPEGVTLMRKGFAQELSKVASTEAIPALEDLISRANKEKAYLTYLTAKRANTTEEAAKAVLTEKLAIHQKNYDAMVKKLKLEIRKAAEAKQKQ